MKFTQEQKTNLLKLLGRVHLEGKEVPAFNEIVNVLMSPEITLEPKEINEANPEIKSEEVKK